MPARDHGAEKGLLISRKRKEYNFNIMQAIGFFDSGVGGLSIWREAIALLPGESTVYLADNAHCPYGSKKETEIVGRCKANTEFLLSQNCKMIVVACNTATAAAIDFLRSRYPCPFIGLEPAVKPASLASRSHRVGVLATSETLRGRLFQRTSARLRPKTKILVQSVQGWVEAVEKGETEPTPETIELVRSQIAPLLEQGVDGLVLGCTHFPFLEKVIRIVAGPHVSLYDPAKAVAKRIQSVLTEKELLRESGLAQHDFFCTGSTAPLDLMLERLLPGKHPVQLDSI